MGESKADGLPSEIVQNILSRLPVKSLRRCQCVSKSWHVMISDPYFIKVQLEQSHKWHPNNLFISEGYCLCNPDAYSLLKMENRKSVKMVSLELPFIQCSYRCRIKCSCNGVILFELSSPTDFYYLIWNPSIGKWSKILRPYKSRIRGITSGLCYDELRDDFKIVAFYSGEYAVYSCKNNSWTLKNFIHGEISTETDQGIFVCGALYWISIVRGEKCEEQILLFDPRDDELHLLQRPEDISEYERLNLTTLKGSLCLYTRSDEKIFRIWLMTEHDTWTKLMNLDYRRLGEPYYLERMWFVNEGNDVLLKRSHCSMLLLYSIRERRFEKIWSSPKDCSLRFLIHLDTLYFPASDDQSLKIPNVDQSN